MQVHELVPCLRLRFALATQMEDLEALILPASAVLHTLLPGFLALLRRPGIGRHPGDAFHDDSPCNGGRCRRCQLVGVAVDGGLSGLWRARALFRLDVFSSIIRNCTPLHGCCRPAGDAMHGRRKLFVCLTHAQGRSSFFLSLCMRDLSSIV